MFRVVDARWLAPDVRRLDIEAPRVAARRQAGQFVIVRVHEHGERIPLTIADSDAAKGTVTIMVDGTGMCGGCRVLVGGRARFACVDGPEFDAHQADARHISARAAMRLPRSQSWIVIHSGPR